MKTNLFIWFQRCLKSFGSNILHNPFFVRDHFLSGIVFATRTLKYCSCSIEPALIIAWTFIFQTTETRTNLQERFNDWRGSFSKWGLMLFTLAGRNCVRCWNEVSMVHIACAAWTNINPGLFPRLQHICHLSRSHIHNHNPRDRAGNPSSRPEAICCIPREYNKHNTWKGKGNVKKEISWHV